MRQINFGLFAQYAAARSTTQAAMPVRSALAKDLVAAIDRVGTTQSAIAEYLNVSRSSVQRVIHGSMRSTRIERELEKIVGQPIFPPLKKPGRKKSVWTGRVAA